jgi:hypothetical protein
MTWEQEEWDMPTAEVLPAAVMLEELETVNVLGTKPPAKLTQPRS